MFRRIIIIFSALLLSLSIFGAGFSPEANASSSKKLTPTQYSRTKNSIALKWDSYSGEFDKYKVKVSKSSKMSKPKYFYTKTNYIELTKLSSSKNYYVQISTLGASGKTLSKYGKAKKFRTQDKKGYSILPPVDLSINTLSDTSVMLNFKARSGVSKYRVQYGKSPEKISGRLVIFSNQAIIPNLDPNSQYYFSVKTLDSSENGTSYYSPFVSGKTLPSYSSKVNFEKTDVKVGSYNIRHFTSSETPETPYEKPWDLRKIPLISEIRNNNLDVLGIQEASVGYLANSTLTQYDDLIYSLGDPYRLVNYYRYPCLVNTTSTSCSSSSNGASGAVRIVYNADTVKVIRFGSLKITGLDANNKRDFAWAEFEQLSNGKHFIFGATHLIPPPAGATTGDYSAGIFEIRVQEAKEIAAEINRIRGNLPVILTGDMNSKWSSLNSIGKRENPQYEIFKGIGLNSVINDGNEIDRAAGFSSSIKTTHLNYHSFSGFLIDPPKTSGTLGTNIDYIYISQGILAKTWENVLNLDTFGKQIEVIPSDHNMITSTVTIG